MTMTKEKAAKVREQTLQAVASLVKRTAADAREAKARHEAALEALSHLESGRSLETCPLPSYDPPVLPETVRLVDQASALLRAGCGLEPRAPRA